MYLSLVCPTRVCTVLEAVLMFTVGSVVENWAKEEKGQSKSVSY